MRGQKTLLLLIGAVTLAAASCGGSESTGTGGTSGGGSGGSGPGVGGSSGSGGSGVGGTTGSAGTNGGSGGSGGTAGSGPGGGGGSGGATGGSGGATGGSGGATGGTGGGTAGSGGSGGAGGRGGGTAGTGGGTAGAGGSGGTGGGSGGTGGSGSGTFRLTSSMFTDGMPLPVDATCATTMANSRIPDLTWTGAPAGAMSFAIAFVDATMLPASTGFHSVMWDIPGTVSMIPAGLPAGSPPAGIAELSTVKQKNPLRAAYLGPCPNMGGTGTTGPVNDTYEFRLYAFPVATLPANLASMSTQNIINALANNNPLGMAVLKGTSNARGSLK
jgi:phosphatidylethanolamine-binding protein (PEBP) family uncharacterized protein